MRPLHSYAKVQALFGRLRRNRRFQLRARHLFSRHYLDLGCGPNVHAWCVNLDYMWKPGVDVCWDIRRGLPFAAGRFAGVFSEHCLEHFDLTDASTILCETKRVLAPGGILRIIVPDAGLYLSTYARQTAGDQTVSFPFQAQQAADPAWTPLLSVNRLFYQDRNSPAGHRMLYDEAQLSRVLTLAGFHDIRRCEFGLGADSKLLLDTPARRIESLYMEARA